MTERRFYRFAGLDIAVEMPAEIMYRDERNLASFRVESVSEPHRFTFDFVEELPQPEGTIIVRQPNFTVYAREGREIRYIGGHNAYLRAEHCGMEHMVQVERRMYGGTIGTKTVLECIGVEHLTARNNGFLFHCSYIDYNGKAILFTAPSETGKSTQAELWHRYRGAEIINGDRAAVRLVDGRIRAEGIPFSGSSQYCKNRSLPVAAIVYLAQAPKTSIRKMRGYEAFSRIWEGISVNTWDRQDMEQVSSVVQKTAEQIPVYYLPCTPDESAVTALEEELKKLEQL